MVPCKAATDLAKGRAWPDTEEVTGSNPVAPTTVLTGQGPVSAWPTALLTCGGRAAAAVCSLAELSGRAGWAVRTDDTGPSPAQRPRSVVTTSRSSPMVGHHADNLPKCTCGGTGEHPLVLVLPSQPTSTLALDQLPRRPGGARRRRSLCACDTAAQIRHRPSCEPPTANAAPSLPSDPMRAGDHAARGPRRHVEPITPTGAARPPSQSTGQRGSDSAAAEPRTPETRPSGHTCMAPDAWTPDAWTPDVRLTDWTRTSAQRTEHADRATTGVAGVRTSSRPATNRWAARPRPGRSVWWRSASHNGSA